MPGWQAVWQELIGCGGVAVLGWAVAVVIWRRHTKLVDLLLRYEALEKKIERIERENGIR